MERFESLLSSGEDWLINRVLFYAKQQGYTEFTSTLREAWRLSISGLTDSIIMALKKSKEVPEMKAGENDDADPITHFGMVEARRHRKRGIDLGMFLGLMKYYRQSYLDYLLEPVFPEELRSWASLFLTRVFDRIEIGFCVEWAQGDLSTVLRELQSSNRLMTNEKNKYLTVFESVSMPLVLLNSQMQVEQTNLAANRLLRSQDGPGSHYYRDRQLEGKSNDSNTEESELTRTNKTDAKRLMPWLADELDQFIHSSESTFSSEKEVLLDGQKHFFSVALSEMLDVSGKYEGLLVALEDVTQRKEEEAARMLNERLVGVVEMAGAAAHEISQPTQTLLIGLEGLLEDCPALRNNQEVTIIQESCDRITKLLNKIQQITKYETMDYGDESKIIDVEKASR